MKITNLIDHIQSDNNEIELEISDGKSLTIKPLQSCFILVENRSNLQSFLKRNKNVFDQNSLNITTQKLKSTATKLSVKSIGDLLNQLRDISNGVHGILDFPQQLKLIKINNLSDFYWDLQILNQRNFSNFDLDKFYSSNEIYKELGILTKKIYEKYNCAILVCSYDVSFENGLNSDKPYYYKSEIQRYSKLPTTFLESFSHFLHFSTSIEEFKRDENKWNLV
ncbi:hypothetical protein KGF54_004460 [Candida jiufengensis]|uniref:uncharacterized protein n=1 Tax=Candida jiufengensis TaxID=497108 RepID=UPI002225446E|nr:uncharacterized protein KGF54_004460 [Candida jiufengensis]KAI5951386.1 hypothetical protein KGF54_004460 [Candida jiufengensis]